MKYCCVSGAFVCCCLLFSTYYIFFSLIQSQNTCLKLCGILRKNIFQEKGMNSSHGVRNSNWARNGCYEDTLHKTSEIDSEEQNVRAGVQSVLQV